VAAHSGGAAKAKRSFRESLALFIERRALAMLALGFAAGLPILLVFDTLSAWFRDAGLPLEVIGYFSLATLLYSLKFLWAPVIDRSTVPYLTTMLGHRRSWMLLCQILIVAGLLMLATRDPLTQLGGIAFLALFVGFFSATQDIVIDAWRIEAADASRQGVMAATYQWGYMAATVTAGTVTLVLADLHGWNLAYGAMGLMMGAGIVATLFAPREAQHKIRPIPKSDISASPFFVSLEWALRSLLFAAGALLAGSGLTGNDLALRGPIAAVAGPQTADGFAELWRSGAGIGIQLGAVVIGLLLFYLAARPLPGTKTRPGIILSSLLGEPLADFLQRYRGTAGLILAVLCFYRISNFILNILNPFYLDLGFTLAEVGEVRVAALVASLIGLSVGGVAVARLGLMRALVIGALAGPITNLALLWLTTRGPDLPSLFVVVCTGAACSGFAGTCLIAYMSTLTSQGFTATQYALFTSLFALPSRLIAALSGRMVENASLMAEQGGALGLLKDWFSRLPPEAFAQALQKSGVSPAALAAGYAAYFLYAGAFGLLAIGLAMAVASRERKLRAANPASA
jgi:PAT family beta-lactamase induction signal transducer AmpG